MVSICCVILVALIPASNEPNQFIDFGTCLHEHLVNAARVKYPAALLRIKLDTPSACCGVFDSIVHGKQIYSFVWRMPRGSTTSLFAVLQI